MSAHSIFYSKLRSKTFLFYSFCILCVATVAGNILFSQKYNNHMYGVMMGDSDSATTYLKHIWGTPLYGYEVATYAAEGRGDILLKWDYVQKENTRRIQSLEEAIQLHPYSPELYYNLSLLYLESGDKTNAQKNLKKAQEIDPAIQ